jgi:hypothetical protein
MRNDWPPRTWNRGIWKWWHRASRIAARETSKCMVDMIAYGTGLARVTANGVECIPYKEVMDLPPWLMDKQGALNL